MTTQSAAAEDHDYYRVQAINRSGARVEIRHLRAFAAVAEERHFGRAAARLHMAQPPVSQQIQQLEAELGVKLFERSTRSVSLTAAGQAFLEPARRVLNDMELARRAAVFGTAGISGSVSIGFAGASSRYALPAITRAVRNAQPGIELSLRGQVYGGAAISQILSGELDIGLTRLPIRDSNIESHVFDFETLLAALPEDHPLASKPSLKVADLAAEPFITFPATKGSTVRDATSLVTMQAGFMPRIVQEAPDSYTILSLVAAGVGVSITVSSVRHFEMPGLRYREFDEETPRLAAAIAWHKGNTDPAVLEVIDLAKSLLPTPVPVPSLVLE